MENPQSIGCTAEPSNQAGSTVSRSTYIWGVMPGDASYITKVECYKADAADDDFDVGVFTDEGGGKTGENNRGDNITSGSTAYSAANNLEFQIRFYIEDAVPSSGANNLTLLDVG